MRILALCKRRPQGRDLFLQPYGRFYYLCRLLADRGHQVELKLLSYDRQPSAAFGAGGLTVTTDPALPDCGYTYYRAILESATDHRPDWIIGFSDIWYAVLATQIARRRGIYSLIDAYDNFETYHPMIPPLPQIWRRALRQASRVTAAGPQLAGLMSRTAGGRSVDTIPMAADPCFYPRDRDASRRQLGLPTDTRLVGYTGAVDEKRGVDFLFRVYTQLKARMPDVRLVMSGRRSKHIRIPSEVIWLGYRPPEDIPLLINSLDLVFVINRPSDFGNYSYPAKLYEAMRCGKPIVASAVPGTAWALRDHPHCLSPPGDVADFVLRAVQFLDDPRSLSATKTDYGMLPDWEVSAVRLETVLQSF